MNHLVGLLVTHGYLVLFVAVIGRQACLPVPTNLLMLAAGALVGLGKLNLTAAVSCAVMAFLIADVAWYEAGRIWGSRTLHLFCNAAHNPTMCVDKMVGVFDRHGLKALLISKFIIGLDSITSPLSGITRVQRSIFLAFDGAGALLWVIAYMGVGYVFRNQLDHVAKYSEQISVIVGVIAIAAVLVVTFRRVIHWVRWIRAFQPAEITLDLSRNRLT